jgi:hypothetical protein
MNKFEPSISSLRLVIKIVQTGKLTSAASQSHMSQSAASHALGVLVELQTGDLCNADSSISNRGETPGDARR